MKNNDPFNPNFNEMEEDIKTNHVGGLPDLERYAGSDLNLTGWELTDLLDDVLLVEFADEDIGGKGVIRGGIILPTEMTQKVWRIGKVLLAGPKASIKKGQYVMFPNDKGLQANNVNGKKKVVFLNQQRVFGVVVVKE